jgi:GNAT superfamily N-acetyltransferase
VRSWIDRRQFIELPYRLHLANTNWVPPLRVAQRNVLNTKTHPFYKTSDAELFLAKRGGHVVGRVMAILNRAHNEFHNESAGFFGFFEAENDTEVAGALFEAASDWLRARGATVMRGPTNPSTNYEVGLLVEGFDRLPAVMMTYNPPYYVRLIEQCGLQKGMDLYAYEIDEESFVVSEKVTRVAERLKNKAGISVRTVDLKNFNREVDIVRNIYNNAWVDNWGFVPFTDEEFDHIARDLKQIADPRILYIAEQEVDGQPRPIAFMLALPDINRALKKISGRLFPFGLFKLLWHSRKISHIRVIIMGVVREHQNLGIAALFYDQIYRQGPGFGYHSAEMSWILETNKPMNRSLELVGARRAKTYRIYEKPL